MEYARQKTIADNYGSDAGRKKKNVETAVINSTGSNGVPTYAPGINIVFPPRSWAKGRY